MTHLEDLLDGLGEAENALLVRDGEIFIVCPACHTLLPARLSDLMVSISTEDGSARVDVTAHARFCNHDHECMATIETVAELIDRALDE